MRVFFEELLLNRALLSVLCAWGAAQLIKAVLYGVINHEFRLERFFGSGGMPSSHSASVCALAVATAYNYGVASFEFTICFVFAMVVLHDAQGVRLEAGRQAEAINALYEFLMNLKYTDLPEYEKLKELVGHTPLQVLIGGLIGILTGILLH